MLNALRLVEGFTLERFEARTGLPRTAIAAPLERARANGWLELDGEHVRPTALGRRFGNDVIALFLDAGGRERRCRRSEEHTSELQSLMRISYAGFGVKKKTKRTKQ